jgi:regulator of PEP synthase PpsR (kinase-PPPase family)
MQMSVKTANIHLVSDSTGDTLLAISSSIVAQFPSVDFKKFTWFLTRTENEMNTILEGIKNNHGIVMYTIAEAKFEEMLQVLCSQLNIPCIPVLSKFIRTFQRYLGYDKLEQQHNNSSEFASEIPAGYANRIEAINYTIAHDDGGLLEDLDEADIIIIGASRTSKTPVSIYLSYRGYKVVNIPFVTTETFPSIIFSIKKPLIVGLVADAERLEAIRKSRLSSLSGDAEKSQYTDLDKIREEIVESRKLFTKLACPVINITEKSIEETSVYIMKQLTKKIAMEGVE